MVGSRSHLDAAELDERTLERIERKLDALTIDHAAIKTTLGQEGPDGKGGTGLVGRLIRLESGFDALEVLKHRGLAVVVGVGFVLIAAAVGLRDATKIMGHTLAAFFGA